MYESAYDFCLYTRKGDIEQDMVRGEGIQGHNETSDMSWMDVVQESWHYQLQIKYSPERYRLESEFAHSQNTIQCVRFLEARVKEGEVRHFGRVSVRSGVHDREFDE